VFNMGIGLVLAVSPADAAAVLAAVPGAIHIGHVKRRDGPAVQLLGL
jgi:phosphoribosylaminoimidazole (AIR) synthetase